jgi:hypothetical protein
MLSDSIATAIPHAQCALHGKQFKKKTKKTNIVLQTLNVSPLVKKMEDMFGPNTEPYDIGTYIAYGKDYPNSFRA